MCTAGNHCSPVQIENLQDQLRDKDKQLGGLKDRVKSLQTDTSNTDTALGTLEEALAEKVPTHTHVHDHPQHNCMTLHERKLTSNHICCPVIKSVNARYEWKRKKKKR